MIKSITKKFRPPDPKKTGVARAMFSGDDARLVDMGFTYKNTRYEEPFFPEGDTELPMKDWPYETLTHHDSGTTTLAYGPDNFHFEITGLPNQIKNTCETLIPVTGELEEIVE